MGMKPVGSHLYQNSKLMAGACLSVRTTALLQGVINPRPPSLKGVYHETCRNRNHPPQ